MRRTTALPDWRWRAVLIVLCALPVLIAAAWGGVYDEAAYGQFRAAQAVAAGTGEALPPGTSPLYTLLLALVERLSLPLPASASVLGALGWTAAVAVWFLTGAALDRPTVGLAAALLLALHPLQGRVAGLEPGWVLAGLGVMAWLALRGNTGSNWTRPALLTLLPILLAALQPLPALLGVPLLALGTQGLGTLRKESRSAHLAAALALGLLVYAPALALSRAWTDPRLLVAPVAAVQLLVALGVGRWVPRLDALLQPPADRRALPRGVAVLLLLVLLVGQVLVLGRAWLLRPVDRLALYQDLAGWLREQSLPGEMVAAPEAQTLGYLAGRRSVPLPAGTAVPGLLASFEQAPPDYCLLPRSLAWQGVQVQPWFSEHYQEVRRVASPYDAASPLILYRYTPSPFDAGEIVSATGRFALSGGASIDLAGYRLDSRRIAAGRPLHLTLYWRTPAAAAAVEVVEVVDEPLRLVLRLVDAAGGQVRLQAENPAPGGLPTDLWGPGTVLADRYTLVPPTDLAAGDYVLEAALYRPNGSPVDLLVDGSPGGERLALTRVACPPSVSTVHLAPDHPLSLTLGSAVELLGYDAPDRVAPGETLRVALYWRARQPIALDYKVFVHLLGPGDQVLAQDDSQPVHWAYPTTRWQPGETVRDEHLLAVDGSVPRGDYVLFVGLYDPAGGDRLPVYGADGVEQPGRRVRLQEVRVR